ADERRRAFRGTLVTHLSHRVGPSFKPGPQVVEHPNGKGQSIDQEENCTAMPMNQEETCTAIRDQEENCTAMPMNHVKLSESPWRGVCRRGVSMVDAGRHTYRNARAAADVHRSTSTHVSCGSRPILSTSKASRTLDTALVHWNWRRASRTSVLHGHTDRTRSVGDRGGCTACSAARYPM
ncbi:hypothetical protein THAOC_08833, partial [Thalassiosira oceanica]